MFSKKKTNLKNTLLFRLTLLYALIFICSTITTFLIFYYRIYSVTMENVDLDLLSEITAYQKRHADRGLDGVLFGIREEAEEAASKFEFYRLAAFDGDILAATDMSAWGDIAVTTRDQLDLQPEKRIYQTIKLPGRSYDARMLSAVIGPGMVMQIGETFEDAEEYLQVFRDLFLTLFLVLIVVSIGIGWLVAGRALSDMEEVTKTAEEITRGDYDRRVQLTDQFEEIKRLGEAFNKMLDRIQQLLRSMKEINDNIAHDLRSPLTRIRGIAEMALLKEGSADDYRAMATSTVEECDNLIDLINTMLDITEAEARVNSCLEETFDLADLLRQAGELFSPISDAKQIRLEIDTPRPLPFMGDRKKMQRIVTNLIENAIKYTPESGLISVSVNVHDDMVQIAVKDTGTGISETDLPRIFERFYRCDRSRSQSGAGLGLSLARAYTRSMNGTIHVMSALNQGSTFIITFKNRA